MCMNATCSTCAKKTWRGCGQHIPSALGGVDESNWCTCEPKVVIDGKAYPPAATMQIPGASSVQGLFGGGAAKDSQK